MSVVQIRNLREQNEKKYQAMVSDIQSKMMSESLDIMRLGMYRVSKKSMSDEFLSRLIKDYEDTGEWTVSVKDDEIRFNIVDHEKNHIFLMK